jgi:hypothetical protein
MNREEHIEDNQFYHVYNRGNDRERIFGDESDYEAFIKKMKSLAIKHSVDIPVYVLMPNHYHLIAIQRPVEEGYLPHRLSEEEGNLRAGGKDYLLHRFNRDEGNLHRCGNLSNMMGALATSAAKRYNLKYGHIGHLFQGPFRYRSVSEEALWYVACYIHLNPVSALLAKLPEAWQYSNFGELVELSQRFPSGTIDHKQKETFYSVWQGYPDYVRSILRDKRREKEFWVKVKGYLPPDFNEDEGNL